MKIEFTTDNAWFADDKETAIAETLREIANNIEIGNMVTTIRDGNGNTIGHIEYDEED